MSNVFKTNRHNHPDRLRLLFALESYLNLYPDLRVGQAIENARHVVQLQVKTGTVTTFYVEDGALASAFEEMIRKATT